MNHIDKEQCSGCTACVNICPKKCIHMEEDKEGFLYPMINESECLNCGLCEKVCPIAKTSKKIPLHVFAIKNKNEDIRNKSTSGGVFSNLAKYVLNEKNGVVCGCKFNDKLEVVHDFVEKYNEIEEFRGAKYSQSRLDNVFKKVKEFLNEGRYVLFTGTPCQVGGLDAFLGKKYDKLIKCDLVCHSVPSPKALKKYIEEIENIHDKKVEKIWFRNKELYGWKRSNIKVVFEDGTIYKEYLRDTAYMKGFNLGLFNRPSCANCSYKDFKGVSDITIADFWGIENVNNEFFDNIGVSLVFVNTEIGNDLFNKIKNEVDFIETSIEDAVARNPFVLTSSPIHQNRKSFFERIDNENFSELVGKLLN